MMTIHRMMLKTHLLLTTHVRSVHSILFRSSLQTTKRRGGLCPIRAQTVGNLVGSLTGRGDANPQRSETSPLADNRAQSSANPVEVQVLSSAYRRAAGRHR
jgi:hypothetical protein